MKQTRSIFRSDKKAGAAETYRILNEAGNEVTSFTLDDSRPSVTLHLERQGLAVESPLKRLEREAWAYYETLAQTIDQIEAISPAAAEALFSQMFSEEE